MGDVPGEAMPPHRRQHRPPGRKALRLALGIGLTASMFLLVGAALAPVPAPTFFAFTLAGLVAAAIFYLVFPGNRLFLLTFANLVAVYTCIFALYLEVSFPHLPSWLAALGYVLPLLSFVAGTVLRGNRVRQTVELHMRRAAAAGSEGGPARQPPAGQHFTWLLPLAGIGAVALVLPNLHGSPAGQVAIFALAMVAISVQVLLVSVQVAAFLVEASILFADLFARFARLAQPIFAFLTLYSTIVIVFAALYRVMDRFAEAPLFQVAGATARIDFAEALYFSIVTLSTLGYGDIVPASAAVQALVAIEVVLGLLLLLFGFGEIIGASRRPPRD
ncbi:MAG: ion channel [Sneathiellaceae bacterium]